MRCATIDFETTNHHHALADAEAAGFACLHICKEFGEEAMFRK